MPTLCHNGKITLVQNRVLLSERLISECKHNLDNMALISYMLDHSGMEPQISHEKPIS